MGGGVWVEALQPRTSTDGCSLSAAGSRAPERWEVGGIKVMHQWLPVKEIGGGGG